MKTHHSILALAIASTVCWSGNSQAKDAVVVNKVEQQNNKTSVTNKLQQQDQQEQQKVVLTNMQTATKKTQAVKIEALDESFLLFLAELEEIDGELIHPVDLKENKEKSKATKDEN